MEREVEIHLPRIAAIACPHSGPSSIKSIGRLKMNFMYCMVP